MKTIALIAVATLGLAACETTRSTTITVPAVATCDASPYQTLVGQRRTVLAAMTVPAGTRIIEPNSMVTMDNNPNRLNIEINDSNRISAVRCG